MKNVLISAILLVFVSGCQRENNDSVKSEKKQSLLYGKKLEWYSDLYMALNENKDRAIIERAHYIKSNGFIDLKRFQGGIAIVKTRNEKIEEGVFLFSGSSNDLPSGSGYSFEEIDKNIYWYEFKKRTQ